MPRADCDGVGIDRSDNDELMANNAGVRTNAKRANEMHKGTKDLALSWIMIISLVSDERLKCGTAGFERPERSERWTLSAAATTGLLCLFVQEVGCLP